ncbi:unnamed protein product [Adineta steineri]|uniref:Uncharacterized protein n=1 Tax=Adineta steineri TaxID=433720 RepID=A0A814NXM1_9BILA|nr:unnamed protein product [Adineta steineri]CAF1097208.1 unnamed protein product [Adineta steineri]
MPSHSPRIITYIYYRKRRYRCSRLNPRTAGSVNQIRCIIPAALGIQALSSHDIIKIKDDQNVYVDLNDNYLRDEKPWETPTDTKIIELEIESTDQEQSNTEPIFVPSIQSASESENHDQMEISTTNEEQDTSSILSKADVKHTDLRDPVTTIDITGDIFGSSLNCDDLVTLIFMAPLLGEPLKFIHDVAPQQRLQYPEEENLGGIQTIKNGDDKKNSRPPTLQVCGIKLILIKKKILPSDLFQVPIEYVKVIEAGGQVDLISAIVSQGNNQDQVPDFYLAPFRGFWPFGKQNRPSSDTPFSDPMVQRITCEQINPVQTAEGEISYQIK